MARSKEALEACFLKCITGFAITDEELFEQCDACFRGVEKMAAYVNDLVRAGLVECQKHTGTARRWYRLTPAGLARKRQLLQPSLIRNQPDEVTYA